MGVESSFDIGVVASMQGVSGTRSRFAHMTTSIEYDKARSRELKLLQFKLIRWLWLVLLILMLIGLEPAVQFWGA